MRQLAARTIEENDMSAFDYSMIPNKKGLKRARGFTLVELIIIFGVIAILAAIAFPNIIRARLAANDVVAQATLKTLGSAFESYSAINGRYPEVATDLIDLNPPYINQNYFDGTHSGFIYEIAASDISEYTITATPEHIGRTGTRVYTITTGCRFLP